MRPSSIVAARSATAKLPTVLANLLNRTILATFRLTPRPSSLSDSMAIHQEVSKVVSPFGKIVHYRQSICPVTKERLEKLQVLIEDLDAQPSRVDIVHRGELLESKLSPLEHELVSKFLPTASNGSHNEQQKRVILESATRSPERIMSLKFLEL